MRLSKTQNFIETTKEEFQQYRDEPISDSQATDIQNNLFGVVDLLMKWGSNSLNAIKEGLRVLQEVLRLVKAKDKHSEIELMLNNGEETDDLKMKKRFPSLK